MKWTALFALCLLPLVVAPRNQATAQSDVQRRGIVTLASLQDASRPLLIFAPKPDDPQMEIQLRTMNAHAHEAVDRDMTVIAMPYNNPSPTLASMSSSEAEAARHRFNVGPDEFAVILIGKDGGEKLRSAHPIPFDQLRETIDVMPMRRDEMKQKAAGR